MVAIFTTLFAGLAETGPPAIIVVLDEEVAVDTFVVELPDTLTLLELIKLVVELPLEILVEPPPEPNELPPKLDEKVIAGAVLLAGDTDEIKTFERLVAVSAGMPAWLLLVAEVCELIETLGRIIPKRPLI